MTPPDPAAAALARLSRAVELFLYCTAAASDPPCRTGAVEAADQWDRLDAALAHLRAECEQARAYLRDYHGGGEGMG